MTRARRRAASPTAGSSSPPLTFATHLWQVYLLYGALASLAFAATSPVNTTKLISGWFVERRALALSIGTSGAAFGQLAIVPLATWIMVTWNWRASYWTLAAVALLVLLPLGYFVVRDAPADAAESGGRAVGRSGSGESRGRESRDGSSDSLQGAPADCPTARPPDRPAAVSLRQALRTPTYWQLSFGFFVCGFTMSFTSVHMVPYMLDMPEHSHHTMQLVASTALSVVGGCSILGALALGYLADRAGHKPILALTYFLRGLAFVILLLVGSSLPGIFVAAVVLGISWTSTTPLTSAISADVYGRAALGTIFGFMFSAMNVGGGVGAWLAGLNYDLTGNYHTSLLLNGFLGFAAAAAVLSAKTRPLRPDAATPAPPLAEPQPALSGTK